jgi:serine acetyltransferase
MTCLNLCINYPKKVQFVYKYEIPRTAQIGSGVTFNHKGLGVVIHPNSQIEDNVYIEHHVCLGQRTGTNTAAPVVRKYGNWCLFRNSGGWRLAKDA